METRDETLSDLALEYGVELTDPSPDTGADIALRAPDWREATAYRIKVYPTRLTPNKLPRIIDNHRLRPSVRLLLAMPVASSDFLAAAQEHGISVVATSRHSPVRGRLISTDGAVFDLIADVASDPRPRARRGPVPWSMFAVALELARSPARQRDIAAKLDITQGSVSQSKHAIGKWLGGRASSTGGWPTDHAGHTDRSVRELILWQLAADYPRLSRAKATTWMSLANPLDAAQAASGVLTSRGIQHAVSGQVAADRYAPWARPGRALIWAEQLIDMSEADATPVPAADANLIVATSEDPYLFVDMQTRDGLPVLAPERVWIDLTREGEEQAAEALLTWLLRQDAR